MLYHQLMSFDELEKEEMQLEVQQLVMRHRRRRFEPLPFEPLRPIQPSSIADQYGVASQSATTDASTYSDLSAPPTTPVSSLLASVHRDVAGNTYGFL